MRLTRWDDVEREPLKTGLARQVIHGDKMTLARVHLARGAVVPMHSHVNEQMSIVESGRLRFVVSDREFIMSAGDMLMIPSDAPHMVEALEDSVALDINSPVRQDWLAGDDAYLRGGSSAA